MLNAPAFWIPLYWFLTGRCHGKPGGQTWKYKILQWLHLRYSKITNNTVSQYKNMRNKYFTCHEYLKITIKIFVAENSFVVSTLFDWDARTETSLLFLKSKCPKCEFIIKLLPGKQQSEPQLLRLSHLVLLVCLNWLKLVWFFRIVLNDGFIKWSE